MKKLKFLLVAIAMIACSSLTAQVSINYDTSPPHTSAMLDVQAIDKGMLIPRMTQAQRIAITNPAAGLMVYQLNGMTGFHYFNGAIWSRLGIHSGHYVGEPFGGGIIFQLDETGEHGLIFSMVDLSQGMPWSNVTDVEIGESAQSHWNGNGNSLAIVGQPLHMSSASKICLDYINTDYGTGIFFDWYLPSLGEAIHLFHNLYELQKAIETDGNPATIVISNGTYWSSSENDNLNAWAFPILGDGGKMLLNAKSVPCFVRAIRAF